MKTKYKKDETIADIKAASVAAPFTLEQLEKVANRYAPIVRFHPKEPYFMCTVDWYLQRGTLCGLNGYKKSAPAVSDLPTGNTDDGKYWLEMTEDAKKGDLATARTYVHAWWQQGNGYTDLQYWFCYGYNGPGTLNASNPFNSNDISLAPLGEHWIDWEQMTVRIKNETQEVLGVFLSQHGEGEWITDLKRFERKNDQFIVYASLNGHALYAQPGINPTNAFDAKVISFYLRNDTATGGAFFDAAGKLDIVSADFIPGLTEPKWLHFPYRYGLGSDTHITKEAVAAILKAVLGPFGWILKLVGGSVIEALAEAILPVIKFDDTNGVYGPQTQSYWASRLIPKFNISTGYTGSNTNADTPPSITFFKGLYHIFFQDYKGKGIMHLVSADGITWAKPTSWYTGKPTSAGPCSIVYENLLHVFYRDGDGNGILHIQSADGENWQPARQSYIGINCDKQPSAAVVNNRLCVTAVDHNSNKIRWAVQTSINGDWSHGDTGYTTNPSTPPCVVAFGNLFHLFFQDYNGKGIMHLTSPDGVRWMQSEVFYTGYETSSGPAAVVFGNLLYLFYRDGSGNGILYLQSADGIGWSPVPCWYIGLNGDHEPRITATTDGSCMCLTCIHAGGNGMMRAVFKPW
jgi:hypothetical protein